MTQVKRPPFWANRILSYWTPYDTEHLLEHIERLEPQVLQIGHFGPLFYSMAHTESWDYFGMPVAGIDEGISWWREFVASVQQRGISVVGLISLGFFFGDHGEPREGFFRFWDELWEESRLGPRPCDDCMSLVQVDEAGQRKCNPRGGETMTWYSACLNNPDWIEAVKRMTTQAIEVIGLDGVNSLYNYVGGCCCEHCQEGLRRHLRERCGRRELEAMGIDDIDAHVFERIPNYSQDGEPDPFELECLKFSSLSLKTTYDEIFVKHGRRLKPDLICAAWLHQSGDDTFGQLGNDERSALPSGVWARDEDYLWYCVGRQEHTDFDKGYLADMTLESKYMRGAGGGMPFIPNRYDHRRLRLYAAESVASGGAAIGWHWDTSKTYNASEMTSYIDELGGYYRFCKRHEELYRATESYADTALVFSRSSVQSGYARFARSLRRLGRRLADGHVLFDIAIDDQLSDERCEQYRTMVFPDARFLGDDGLAMVRAFAANGGQVISTESAFRYAATGVERKPADTEDLIPSRTGTEPRTVDIGRGRAVYLPSVPRDEEEVMEGSKLSGPAVAGDTFGAEFLDFVGDYSDRLKTDAAWSTALHAFTAGGMQRVVLHLVNFGNDESREKYRPLATEPAQVDLRLPGAAAIQRILFTSPDGGGDEGLDFSVREEGRVCFRVPAVEVYGVAVIELAS